MVPNITVKENILNEDIYDYLFSVEEVNKRVLAGMPFREAYKEVGLEIEAGKFKPNKTINHSHEGSIGNLCSEEIKHKMEVNFKKINTAKIKKALNALLD